jgi:hypothetical protein
MDSDKLEELRRAIKAEQDDSATLEAAPRMLDIRTLKRGWLALPYESLRRVEFDPDSKVPLRIHFSSHILELQGRNLQSVSSARWGSGTIPATRTTRWSTFSPSRRR